MQVAGGALSAASSLREQIKQEMEERMMATLKEHDFVRREEFEIVKDMAEKARLENESLRQDIEALKKSKAPASKAKKSQ